MLFVNKSSNYYENNKNSTISYLKKNVTTVHYDYTRSKKNIFFN